VGVPGSVAADLVVVQAGFVLRGLEALLDRPPGGGDADQLRCRRGRGAGAAVERQLSVLARGRVELAADQQPVTPPPTSWPIDTPSSKFKESII
jgi:hypothetical protein